MFVTLVGVAATYMRSRYIYIGGVSAYKIADLAAVRNEPQICDRVRVVAPFMAPSQDDVRAECFYIVAGLLKDIALCDKIKPYYHSSGKYIQRCKEQTPRPRE